MVKTTFISAFVVLLLLSMHASSMNTFQKSPSDSTWKDSVELKASAVTKPSDGLLFYFDRYNRGDLLYKITDNEGNGYDSLYGTRNMRPVIHGVAYRGGGNNVYNKIEKRKNQNPLPDMGVRNLCEEGFSGAVYLYQLNWDDAIPADTCSCINGKQNTIKYLQLDYGDKDDVYEMLRMVYESATNDTVGPLYMHCWNGWHASGLVAAIILKQFCGFSDLDAVMYWDACTDGTNKSPRYEDVRQMIRDFKPYPEFTLQDNLGNQICAEMPEIIPAENLRLTIEHLLIVPETVPVGYSFVLQDITFKPYSTTFYGAERNKDLQKLMEALKNYPSLRVEIGGHTDNTGKASDNYTISKQRAYFIYNWLISQGINKDQLEYKGYGQTQPYMSNGTRYGRSINRRIEARIIDKGEENLKSLVDNTYYEETTSAAAKTDDVTVVKQAAVCEEPAAKKSTETNVVKNVEPLKTAPEQALSFAKVEMPLDRMPAVSNPSKLSFSIFSLYQSSEDYELNSCFVMGNTKFKTGSTEFNTENNEDLKWLLKALDANPNLVVSIVGHTDNSGGAKRNYEISEGRAKAIYDYLISKGISDRQLSYAGNGPDTPRYNNETKEGQELNRRIEIVIRENRSPEKGFEYSNFQLQQLAADPFQFIDGSNILCPNIEFAPYMKKLDNPEKNEDLLLILYALKKYPKLTLTVEGHTDPSGVEEENKLISERRAGFVYSWLLAQGIDESRIGYVGYGSAAPRYSNDTAEGRSMNRRIEIVVDIRK